MAQHICKWNGDWRSSAWGGVRAIWMDMTPEQEAEDVRTWNGAIREDGGFFHVLWRELCQLTGDVAQPIVDSCKPDPPRDI